MTTPSKPWDTFQPLKLIGKVVDLTVGNETYKSVLLDNLKMPRSEEDKVQVYFITRAGRGEPGYIRSRAVGIVATGEEPEPLEGLGLIQKLAGDQP